MPSRIHLGLLVILRYLVGGCEEIQQVQMGMSSCPHLGSKLLIKKSEFESETNQFLIEWGWVINPS